MKMSENNDIAEEERAFNAMLHEAFGGSQPPDLSDQILFRFYNSATDSDSEVQQVQQRKSSRENRSRAKHVTVVAAAIVTLAAMVAGVIALQPDLNFTGSVTELVEDAEREDGGGNGPATAESGNDSQTPKSVKKKNPKRKPLKGIPMIVQTPESELTESELDQGDLPDPPNSDGSETADLAFVSAQVDAEMQGYWEAVGITPTAEATAEETAGRLANALGMEVSVDAVADVEQLQAELAQSLNAEAIARRWLRQITNQRSGRMDAEARDQLVSEIAHCIQTGSSFDKIVAGWLNGESKNTGAFFSALAAGSRSVGGEHGMVRSLAALTLNVDVRCTRCHDAYIEGNGQQSDYWNFVAFLKRGVRKDVDGQFEVDLGNGSAAPVFYELSDGRQRVADARVSANWTSRSASDGYQSIKEFAKGLEGSPELASGVVNSLWQLVHGQPLRGRVVDPISAPHNEALQRLEEQLTEDVIESRFNLARTLALIIASPATRRAVPETLLPENLWVASQEDTSAAMSAVDAFAAVLPPRVSLPAAQRTDQVLRSIGARIGSTGRASLAQIGEGGKVSKAPSAKPLAPDFPRKAELLPVQWLELIKDRDSQINHLGYLAGQNEIPVHVQESVKALKDADVDTKLLLHLAWWLVKP
ncbi:MAG: hypothetical protein CBE00_05050 [Planctomycetaceae bacterium TMED240]|nr:hypothetical protein [Rhodopirellula sp.]OUX07410.1 MAG: hypothetical protein CBE00_05050 [Planctomycetaceae bacterium TMED240]